MTQLIITMVYALSGFAFWFCAQRYGGWPTTWRSGRDPRQISWPESLLIILPICLLIGGILWLVNGAIKLNDWRLKRRSQ
jgi:hypothetical protein